MKIITVPTKIAATIVTITMVAMGEIIAARKTGFLACPSVGEKQNIILLVIIIKLAFCFHSYLSVLSQ